MSQDRLTIGKAFFGKLPDAMLRFIKSSRSLRRLLLATFVFSLTTAAVATEPHDDGGGKGHGGSAIADAALSGESAQPLADRDSDHEAHCTVDALCIAGAWTILGQSPVALRPRISATIVFPQNAPVTGLRPRPELRPPRGNR